MEKLHYESEITPEKESIVKVLENYTKIFDTTLETVVGSVTDFSVADLAELMEKFIELNNDNIKYIKENQEKVVLV